MLTHPFSLKSFLNMPRLRSACSEIARVSHETGMGVGEVGGRWGRQGGWRVELCSRSQTKVPEEGVIHCAEISACAEKISEFPIRASNPGKSTLKSERAG